MSIVRSNPVLARANLAAASLVITTNDAIPRTNVKSKKHRDENAAVQGTDINHLDGRDPRFDYQLYRSESASDQAVDRKARQLCQQVAQTLDYVFSGDARDDLIAGLRVVAVSPAPNTSRMLVTVAAEFLPESIEPQVILERLQQQAGRLRSEVAASIHRRRAPTLVFHVVGG
jgi:ribosome-binding factor A